MTHEVFISYSHHDKLIADGVCANLENASIRCWIAPRDIAPGYDWPTAISEAIKSTRVFVLIFSSRSNKSRDVGRELILAANNNCIIVPFRIEDVPPEPGKEYYLARTHWLDAMDPPTQEQVDKLVSCVRAILVDAGVEFPLKPADKQPPVTEGFQPVSADLVETIQLPPPVSEETKLPVKKSRMGLAAVSGIGTAVIILLLGVILIWQDVLHVPALSSIFSSPTPTITISPTVSKTPIRPTITRIPTDTSTPLPSWVSDFAQPILDAIADQPPTFQDDFGPSSAGWYNTQGWATSRLKYEEEEMIVTGCGLGHAAMNIPNFVLEVDGRFSSHSYQDVEWVIAFRDTTCMPCEIAIHYDCYISIKMNQEYWRINNAALCSVLNNHIMLIVKDSSFAVFANNQPVFFTDDLPGKYGGNSLRVWNDGSTIFENLLSVAFDNIKLWDISDLP